MFKRCRQDEAWERSTNSISFPNLGTVLGQSNLNEHSGDLKGVVRFSSHSHPRLTALSLVPYTQTPKHNDHTEAGATEIALVRLSANRDVDPLDFYPGLGLFPINDHRGV